jgi:hypothetical protein
VTGTQGCALADSQIRLALGMMTATVAYIAASVILPKYLLVNLSWMKVNNVMMNMSVRITWVASN